MIPITGLILILLIGLGIGLKDAFLIERARIIAEENKKKPR